MKTQRKEEEDRVRDCMRAMHQALLPLNEDAGVAMTGILELYRELYERLKTDPNKSFSAHLRNMAGYYEVQETAATAGVFMLVPGGDT